MLPIIRQLTADEKTIVGTTWARRAELKAEVGLRFHALSNAIRAHGAPKGVIELCQRAAQDTQIHVDLCQRIATDFGVIAQVEDVQRPGPLAPMTLRIEHRILYEMVAISCIDEALSGAVLGRVYQATKYPPIRLAAHRLFQDSIWHSRAGWGYLGAMQQQHSVNWLAVHLIELLERTVQHEICRDDANPSRGSALPDYGELTTIDRTSAFKEVVNTVILPGLESYGIDIEQGRVWIKAWVETRESS